VVSRARTPKCSCYAASMTAAAAVIADELVSTLQRLRDAVASALEGKEEAVELALVALLARGHLLIEDVPGVGKTTLARALARAVGGDLRRVQFTSDLLPTDLLGVSVYDQRSSEFVLRQGPIFGNVLLADEINRASPRTQSALLEAMNEGQVSIDGRTMPLPDPFFVIATQNPQDFAGTFPLPESQLDRFLMILRMGYPTPEEERQIIQSRAASDPVEALQAVVSADDVNRLCERVNEVKVDDAVTNYVVEIANRTRADRTLVAGVSPRGAIHLTRAARAHALVDGRDYATPDDIKAVAINVLSHRVVEKRSRASQDGRAASAQILRKILQEIPVPQ